MLLAVLALLVGLSSALNAWHLLALLVCIPLLRLRRSWAIVLGFGLVGWVLRPALPEPVWEQRIVQGTAHVYSMPTETSDGVRFVVGTSKGRFIALTTGTPTVSLGDRVEISGMIGPLREGSTPTMGARGVLRVISLRVMSEGPGLFQLGLAARRSFHEFSTTWLDSRTSGALDALCFNNTSNLHDTDWDALRRAGTVHIISASGLHAMIAAGALLGVLGWVPVPRWSKLAAAMLLMLVYAAAAGFQAPILRAVAMLGIALAAYLVQREPDPVSAASAAGLATALWNPFCIYDIGYFLSYGSVLVLVAMVNWGSWPTTAWASLRKLLVESARTSFWAALATAPLLAWHFGEVSVVSVIANLAIFWPVQALVVGSLGMWLLSWVPGVDWLVTNLIGGLVGFVLGSGEFFASWPFAMVSFPDFSPYGVVLIYVLAFLAWKPTRRPA